ncbi:Uncharacterized protein APZ42_008687, partial [Daphnia magna]
QFCVLDSSIDWVPPTLRDRYLCFPQITTITLCSGQRLLLYSNNHKRPFPFAFFKTSTISLYSHQLHCLCSNTFQRPFPSATLKQPTIH